MPIEKLKKRGVVAGPSPTRRSFPNKKKPLIVQESSMVTPLKKKTHIFDGTFKKEL